MADKNDAENGVAAAKKAAAKQVFEIELPPETIALIQKHLEGWDNSDAAELRFVGDGETKAKFKVAAYSYSNTVCEC